MTELASQKRQMPDTFEDLSKFVLYSETRLKAAREQIRAIQRVNVAKDVYEQKLAEAQEIGEVAVEAAQKMGELLLQIQKQSGANNFSRDNEKLKTKTEITAEMGISKDQVSQYQQMAQNPEAVKAAIQKAIDNGDVVSRSQVMKEIRAVKEEAKRRIEELEARQPEVREVVKQVVPEDYEELKKNFDFAKFNAQRAENDYQKVREENAAQRQRIMELEDQLGTGKAKYEANVAINHFTDATNNYLQMYGGHVWAFSEIENVDEATRIPFIKAIKSLDGFAQQLLKNLGGLNG